MLNVQVNSYLPCQDVASILWDLIYPKLGYHDALNITPKASNGYTYGCFDLNHFSWTGSGPRAVNQ